jgi:diguanylate cyclase (GGDEF)-like protein
MNTLTGSKVKYNLKTTRHNRNNEQIDTVNRKHLPKLKLLLKKYRHLKIVQSSLLQLSELASKNTHMPTFYAELEAVINTLIDVDSFFIVLTNSQQQLSLAYSHNPQERELLTQLNHQNWLQSLTGLVFTQNQLLHCDQHKRSELALSGEIVLYGSQCIDWLGVPLIRGNQVIGVIALQSYSLAHYFDDRDKELLQFIAQYIVIAIDRVQSRGLLEQSIAQRTEKLQQANIQLQKEIIERQKAEKLQQALLSISELTASSLDLDSFYQQIHQQLTPLINAENCYIALFSKDKAYVDFPFYRDEKVASSYRRKLSNGLTEFVLAMAKPVLIVAQQVYVLTENGQVVKENFPSQYQRSLTARPKAYLAAPLIINGVIEGVLAIQDYHRSEAYQHNDLEVLRFISHHIASAIERKAEQVRRQQANDELEKLVIQRTQALQASNDSLRMQIDERRKAETRLYYQAHHDALTQLPNRAMLLDRLSHALRHVKRHSTHKSAVLFIDLDRFKMINDTLGHHTGDLFLIEIAQRLRKCIRDNDVLARLGGDEFVILLDSLQHFDDIEEVASRITTEVSKPFDLDGNIVHSSASIGITHCHRYYKSSDEILRDADAAMYQAKHLGKGRYVFFDESMRAQLLANLTLEQELRIAIDKQQFELHYQEILDLNNSTTLGFEALLRWQHPTKGLLTPSQFLTMAQETCMILEIESWVVQQICQQFTLWQTDKKYENAFISINLSGRHLHQPSQLINLIDLIKSQTAQPERLILEFDEIAFIQQPELALNNLKKLKECGVKVALDDYGANLSSLSFLHDYPFEFIKLDRSFINTLTTNENNLAMVKALTELGEKFGYRLIAEGIENIELLEKVQSVGCEFGQGYFINHPQQIITNKKINIGDKIIKM